MRGRPEKTSGRGVSAVISTLLMVAVTIVLVAMVGSVLLNVISEVDETPLAGTSVTFDEKNDEIRVLYISTQKNGTAVEVAVTNDRTDEEIPGSPKTISLVGDSRTFNVSDGLSDGEEYDVRIVAKTSDGKRAVVLEDDGSL